MGDWGRRGCVIRGSEQAGGKAAMIGELVWVTQG